MSVTHQAYPGGRRIAAEFILRLARRQKSNRILPAALTSDRSKKAAALHQPIPFEIWRYRYIEGIGNDIMIEFVDPTMTGEYRMTMDPSEKDALLMVPGPASR